MYKIREKTDKDNEAIVIVLHSAMTTPPFNRNWTINQAHDRAIDHFKKSNHFGFVAENKEGLIIGAIWGDIQTLTDFLEDHGKEITDFAEENFGSDVVRVFERAVMVKDGFQGLGIGRDLRKAFIRKLYEEKKDAVVFTRMRDDNFAILKLAEKIGFISSKISSSPDKDGTPRHFYYCKIYQTEAMKLSNANLYRKKSIGGKAYNLGLLSSIRRINVPRFIVIYPGMSENEQNELIRGFLKKYRGRTVAVRSSADQEDSLDASFAGMYSTKLRVLATEQSIQDAIKEVHCSGDQKKEIISHYTRRRGLELTGSYISVIVQEMIEADMSGVIFSHDLVKSDSYYAIAVSSGVGESIVGGAANGELIRVARGIKSTGIKDSWIRKLIAAMKVIEKHFQSTSLDVEFAFKNGALYILQCRSITTIKAVMNKALETQLLKRIKLVNVSISSHLHDDVLGDMIDINPIELLGAAPTPLDISIFRYLFADEIVERVRQDMGYDPLNIGLLRVVEGKPYVSMRASAFSFRPMGISDQIYERIVHVYQSALAKNPALQSRVEFALYAMSCGEKLEWVMQEAQLNNTEKSIVREAFLRIDTVFSQVSTIQAENFNAFAVDYEQQTISMENASLHHILDHIAHGTEMFVRIARLAFYWKNKFEELHPQEDLSGLMIGHICSVSEHLQSDLVACRSGTLTQKDIIKQYGHLRPGQFSVFSECYADDPNIYLFAQMERAEIAKPEVQTHAFEDTLEFRHVITFMQARERMKFLFSQSLHLFATKLKSKLLQQGISEYEASQISWDDLHIHLGNSTALVTNYGEKEPPVLLPDVIIPGLTDFRVITFSKAMPSYITNSIVKARVCVLERLGVKTDVRGALVLLPNADPGYDFLFHSGALGIITKVGGPASHMCIRAIELEMPACIGCGESIYQKLMTADSAILDCSTQQIIVLN